MLLLYFYFSLKAREDISLFTVVSIERLERLVSLVEYWNGPMSVAVEISDAEEQLPQFIKTWLTTEKIRKNVDFHLVFNNHVKKKKKAK